MPFIFRPRKTYTTDSKKNTSKKQSKPQPNVQKQNPTIDKQPTLKDNIINGFGIGVGASIGNAIFNSVLNNKKEEVDTQNELNKKEQSDVNCLQFTKLYINCIENQYDCKEIEKAMLNCLNNQPTYEHQNQ